MHVVALKPRAHMAKPEPSHGAARASDADSSPEFDAVAAHYRAQLAQSVGDFGAQPDYFGEYKVADVARYAKTHKLTCHRILDFGAGVGASIPFFQRFFPGAALTCGDVSAESLRLAQKEYGDVATYQPLEGVALPFADDSFDIVFAACVFHHIPAALHQPCLQELHRVLSPAGRFFLFEHNPRNPLTVRVVNRCPFDRNAVLIPAGEMQARFLQGGFSAVERKFRLFFPPVLRRLNPLERALGWCALGAQYSLVAAK